MTETIDRLRVTQLIRGKHEKVFQAFSDPPKSSIGMSI
jgi:hypothetical protein